MIEIKVGQVWVYSNALTGECPVRIVHVRHGNTLPGPLELPHEAYIVKVKKQSFGMWVLQKDFARPGWRLIEDVS